MTPADAWSAIEWQQPLWLAAGLIPLLLATAGRWRRHRRLDRWAERPLQPWALAAGAGRRSGRWRDLAYAAAWLLLAAALAGPGLPESSPPGGGHQGSRLVALVDLSPSMAAADVLPDRRHRARIELEALLPHLGGAALGIVVYAGGAHVLVPPTPDLEALRFYLGQLDALSLPTLGSAHAEGLALAARLAAADAGAGNLLWLTDGDPWPQEGDAPLRAALEPLAQGGGRLYVLGIGSAQGAPVPDPGAADPAGGPRGRWLRAGTDGAAGGRIVHSTLQAAALRHLARAGGGIEATLTEDGAHWRRLLQAGLLPAARAQAAATTVRRRELYPWLLAPAVLLLMGSLAGIGGARP